MAMPSPLLCGQKGEPGGRTQELQTAQLAGGVCATTALPPVYPAESPTLRSLSVSPPSRLSDGRGSAEPDEIRHIHFILRHS